MIDNDKVMVTILYIMTPVHYELFSARLAYQKFRHFKKQPPTTEILCAAILDTFIVVSKTTMSYNFILVYDLLSN